MFLMTLFRVGESSGFCSAAFTYWFILARLVLLTKVQLNKQLYHLYYSAGSYLSFPAKQHWEEEEAFFSEQAGGAMQHNGQ